MAGGSRKVKMLIVLNSDATAFNPADDCVWDRRMDPGFPAAQRMQWYSAECVVII
jgi:hypothetical protein